MSQTILFIILGMAVVTYIPRMLPLVTLNGKKIPPFIKTVLNNVPYAMLGALIVPGIFLVSEDSMFGVIGLLTASIAAYFGANLMLVILSAVGTLMIYLTILH